MVARRPARRSVVDIAGACSPRSAAALTAAYFLRLLRRVTHGPAAPAVVAGAAAGASARASCAWAPLVLLALVLGAGAGAGRSAAVGRPVAALTAVVSP